VTHVAGFLDEILGAVLLDPTTGFIEAFFKAYGKNTEVAHTGKRGRPKGSRRVPVKGLAYAAVHKTRRKGRVVKIDSQPVFGSKDQMKAALETSPVSNTINTAFVERHNSTNRNRNARKVRKSYCFSKDWDVHNAMTYFTMYSCNFCWPVRTLRLQDQNERWHSRTPAMAAGLADHIWSLSEWLSYPAIQFS